MLGLGNAAVSLHTRLISSLRCEGTVTVLGPSRIGALAPVHNKDEVLP